MAGSGMRAVLATVVLLAVMLPVSSLCEDQVGVNDFILKNLGAVTSSVFHPDTQKRRVLVATDAGALASLEVKKGEQNWRQILPGGESVDVLRLLGNQVATLSGGGRHLSLWDERSGNLLWDKMVGEALAEGERQVRGAADVVFLPDQNSDGVDDLAVLHNGAVSLVSGDSGEVLWTVDAAQGDVVLSTLVANDGMSQSSVTVVGASPSGTAAQITTLAALDGSEMKSPGKISRVSGAPKEFCRDHTALSAGVLVCLSMDKSGSTVSLLDIKSGTANAFNSNEISGTVSYQPAALPVSGGGASSFALLWPGDGGATVSEVKKEGETWRAYLRHTLEYGPEHRLVAGQDKNGVELWAHAYAKEIVDPTAYGEPEGLLKVSLIPVTEGSKKQDFTVPGYSRRLNGEVIDVSPNPYVRKDGTSGLRALVMTSSSTNVMVQQEFVAWENHGALAQPVDAAFVDIPVLPPAHDEMFRQASTNPVSALVKRFTTDLADLVQLPMQLSKQFQAKGPARERVQWDTEGVSLRHDMVGDRFGFKKLALVLTEAGVLFGIHTATGAIVWRRYLSDSMDRHIEVERLFVTRPTSSPHYFGLLEVLVLGRNTGPGKGRAMLWWVNPLTGLQTGKQVLKQDCVHAALLPMMLVDHTKLVMLVLARPQRDSETEEMYAERKKGEYQIRVIPDLNEAHKMLDTRKKKIFFYLANDHGLTGYTLSSVPPEPKIIFGENGELDYFREEVGSDQYENMQAGEEIREYWAAEAWNIVLPEGEEIVAMAPHSAEESVKAAGRVLGNRAVLLKYINVNLLAIATQTRGGAGGSDKVKVSPTMRAKEPVLRVYLIDTVVGGIVHNAMHKDATGPVSIAQSEHVVLYSFWHNRKQHTELAVMELYQSTQQEISGAAQVMMFNESSQSSLHMEKPQVLGQAYILPSGVKTIGVTNTMHGITTRNFLLGLATDQVFSLDKRMVDPRRPVTKPTAADTEEGLVPYNPFISLTPTSFLSYNHTIYNLKGISVEPARIESTCHMLAYGIDIFYSKVTPSKAYDCLGDDFNYLSLVISVVGLGIGTQVASHFLQSRELSQAWK